MIILVLLILVIQWKKTDYNIKISKIENKITTDHPEYITAQVFNKLTSENFAARLALVKELSQINQNMYMLKMN